MDARTLSVKQMLLWCGVVVTAVFVVTRASISGDRHKNRQPASTGLCPRLTFVETIWPPKAEGTEANADYEWQLAGHHDFPFRNEGDGPVQVWLQARTCACSRVELGLPRAYSGGPTSASTSGAEDGGMTWQPLTLEDGNGVAVPAHTSGFVRLVWRGRELGPHRLSIKLRTEPGTAPGASITLEAAVNFVAPVQVSLEDNLKQPPGDEIEVGTLGPGDVRTVRILAWSSTRSGFGLQGKPPADACLTCGRPERLSATECARLGRRDGKEVRCAYRIPVTVREQTADGTRLDLGRFHRELQFTPETGLEPITIALGGMVRGQVTVGSAADGGRISLGSFQRSLGKSRQITLAAEPDVPGLEVESCPDFLRVSLREEKEGAPGKAWTLTAEVPPDSLIGPIPSASTIVLRTTGDRPRRIRVPVTGNAYFK